MRGALCAIFAENIVIYKISQSILAIIFLSCGDKNFLTVPLIILYRLISAIMVLLTLVKTIWHRQGNCRSHVFLQYLTSEYYLIWPDIFHLYALLSQLLVFRLRLHFSRIFLKFFIYINTSFPTLRLSLF